MQNSPPRVPERDSSLHGHVTKDEEVLFLAGRKPYTQHATTTPTSSRGVQLTVSTSSTSLTSEGAGLPGALTEDDTLERIFHGSSVSLATSEDAASIHSSTSDHNALGASTPESVRRNLLRPSSQGSLKLNPAPRPESPNPPG